MHSSIMNQVKKNFPEKNVRVTSDDSPWVNSKVKNLKRKKEKSEYNKYRSSNTWVDLNTQFKNVLADAKLNYYKTIVKDIKSSNP